MQTEAERVREDDYAQFKSLLAKSGGAERRGAVEWSRDALPAAGEACEGPAAAERASETHVFGSCGWRR